MNAWVGTYAKAAGASRALSPRANDLRRACRRHQLTAQTIHKGILKTVPITVTCHNHAAPSTEPAPPGGVPITQVLIGTLVTAIQRASWSNVPPGGRKWCDSKLQRAAIRTSNVLPYDPPGLL
jgi:hypothetical protein